MHVGDVCAQMSTHVEARGQLPSVVPQKPSAFFFFFESGPPLSLELLVFRSSEL